MTALATARLPCAALAVWVTALASSAGAASKRDAAAQMWDEDPAGCPRPIELVPRGLSADERAWLQDATALAERVVATDARMLAGRPDVLWPEALTNGSREVRKNVRLAVLRAIAFHFGFPSRRGAKKVAGFGFALVGGFPAPPYKDQLVLALRYSYRSDEEPVWATRLTRHRCP